MSFGFISTNQNDEIVIDDKSQIIGLVRQGTITSSSQTGVFGAWNFDLGPAAPAAFEFVAFELNVGQWVCFNEVENIGSYNVKDITSNSSQLKYKVFAPASVISGPSGYGMAIYDQNSQVCWHDKIISASCDKAIIQTGFSMTSRAYNHTFISSASCVVMTTGTFTLNFSAADAWGAAIGRDSSTQWSIKPKQIASSGFSSTAVDTFFERTLYGNLIYV